MNILKTAIFSSVLFLLISTPILAVEYGGVGGIPAYPREDNPRTESIFVYENAPGSIVNDGVVVVNNSDEKKTVRVYATDTTPSSGGGFACKQYLEEVTEEGLWFELEQDEVILEAKTNVIVPFTVTIPNDVTVGEHNACIVIQEKKPDSTSDGVNLSFRAAIRAMVTVPGDIIRKLAISNFSFEKIGEGKNALNLILSNTGNVSLDTNIKILAKNILTSDLLCSSQGEYSILHNTAQEFNYDLENNIWGGIYRATAEVTYNGNSGDETLTSDLLFFIMPSLYVTGLYLITLIVIVAILVLMISRKRRMAAIMKHAEKYTVQEGDSITSVASNRQVDWKLLAKINHKKAPYELTVGEGLLIPMFRKKNDKAEQKLPEKPVELVTGDTMKQQPTEENRQNLGTREALIQDAVVPGSPAMMPAPKMTAPVLQPVPQPVSQPAIAQNPPTVVLPSLEPIPPEMPTQVQQPQDGSAPVNPPSAQTPPVTL